jgi:hypothetical protein
VFALTARGDRGGNDEVVVERGKRARRARRARGWKGGIGRRQRDEIEIHDEEKSINMTEQEDRCSIKGDGKRNTNTNTNTVHSTGTITDHPL